MTSLLRFFTEATAHLSPLPYSMEGTTIYSLPNIKTLETLLEGHPGIVANEELVKRGIPKLLARQLGGSDIIEENLREAVKLLLTGAFKDHPPEDVDMDRYINICVAALISCKEEPKRGGRAKL